MEIASKQYDDAIALLKECYEMRFWATFYPPYKDEQRNIDAQTRACNRFFAVEEVIGTLFPKTNLESFYRRWRADLENEAKDCYRKEEKK